MLKLVGITKAYSVGPIEVEVLKGIDLEVQRGELLSIMGQSGCGKSTLMNIIGLLDRPSSGTYVMEETVVAYDDDDALSAIRNTKIGFVFQQYNLLPRLTALDNVGVPLTYRGESEDEMRRKSFELLRKVGMQDKAGYRPGELSGGQQQRVAIARALVGNPSLVLADEPTGALDTHVGREIMDLFRGLNEATGLTVIIVTHDPHIAGHCRRLVTMNDGILLNR